VIDTANVKIFLIVYGLVAMLIFYMTSQQPFNAVPDITCLS
jgi:hypothetical protein